jgi:hypothetical protein
MTANERRAAAARRRFEAGSINDFFVEQRARIRSHLINQYDRYLRRLAEARENTLSSAYTFERRGLTYGGDDSMARYRHQED